MRSVLGFVSMTAALVFIGASMLMNWAFMRSLGRDALDQNLLGAASVAASLLLAVLPTFVLWAWRERRWMFVVLGIPAFIGFAAFSLTSAVGFAAKNRGSISEERGIATARLTGLRQDIRELETKRQALGVPRPLAVLEENVRGLEQDRRWQSSKSCREATAEASRFFCKAYFDVKQEAARAIEAGRLDERIMALKGEIRALEERGAGRESDNQTLVLARLMGLPPATVERGMMLAYAVLVEMGAALGLYFATGHMNFSSRRGGQGREGIIIEGEVLRDLPPRKARRDGRQIRPSAPRQVPRLGGQ